MTTELYHVGSACPSCGADIGSPLNPGFDNITPVSRLYCAACGHDWMEQDVRKIAKAWFAAGAWEQHCEGAEDRKRLDRYAKEKRELANRRAQISLDDYVGESQ